MHFFGDLLTATAYFLIPLALIHLFRKRNDLAFNWIFMMAAAFIFLCGVTHFMAIINIWHGYYYLSGIAKLATGIVSIMTTIMIWYLLPRIIAIPSNQEFKVKNEQLLLTQQKLIESNQLLEERVRARTVELEKLAHTDALTGIMNRGGLMNGLTNEMDRATRYKHPLTIMMIDIDHFKRVNDEYGHVQGDNVIIEVADILSKVSRSTDSVGRYGGEEFLLLMPETETVKAKILAERIRVDVANHHFCHEEGLDISVTCSIGVTEFESNQDSSSLLKTVDEMLYKAKNSGRNKIIVNNNIAA